MGAEAKTDNRMSGLIDADMLQRFQDRFCAANGMYVQCVGTEEGQITKAYGSAKEQQFIENLLGKSWTSSLIAQAADNRIENVVEEDSGFPFLKLCAVSTRLEEKTQVIWLIAAFLEEKETGENPLPPYILTTIENRYLKSIEFLEAQSRMLFAVKLDELIAQEAMLKSVESEEHMQRQLHRSEAMTKIVTMLESEDEFNILAENILKLVCSTLSVSGGALIRENTDGATLDLICEYEQQEQWYKKQEFQNIPKKQVPFFNGKPYAISADSMLPEVFARYFRTYGITAAIYQPIEIAEKTIMYLCFHMVGEERIWDVSDIKFINDVKRIVQSILSKRIAKNSLASSYTSLEAILENVGCGICVLDEKHRKVLYTNQCFKDLLSTAISTGRLNQVLEEDGTTQEERLQEVYVESEKKWLDVSKNQIDWVDGRKVALYTLYDITDRKLYQKKIENQANNDFLTGLYNRMRCEQDLKESISQAEKNGSEGAFLFIDLDDFKHINDGLGHQYGDVLLKAISHSLQSIRGIESSCYRVGGDEFVVIVNDTGEGRLEKICRQIEAIFKKPWFLKGEDYFCTMSMGVVSFPMDGNTVDDLIRKADAALYGAKRGGKNRIEFYNSKDTGSFSYRRLDMEKNMRKATLDACREFEVYYQPIVDIQKEGNPVCGAEALVRWNSAEMGFISPVDFIPLAEYLGLINPIGDFVLWEAASRCRYWNDMGHPNYKVNVNLSVIQLLQNDIVKKIQKVVEDTRITPGNLTLEVTESLAINDMDRMKKVLGQIKELGVKVALDDFGTGYSSLNHIREMPIDVIKIDRCFIEHIGEDDFSDAFVKMVSELAATLGVQICTEGVENKKQCEIIKKMSIAYIQGYYFGKPMRIEEFEEKYL